MITLKDDNVLLRVLKMADAARMAKLADNPNISCNLRDGFPNPYTLSDAENFLNKIVFLQPPSIFAIEYIGKYVGNIGLHPGTDVYRKSAEIGYFLGEPYWNKGIMTKAVKLITKYGFEKLSIARIHAGIFEYNAPSVRVLEKCGFEREGIFRKSVFKKGRLWDELRYAKINPSLPE